MLFDPFGDFGKVFVFLAYVVFFAEVDEEDDGFGGEKEEGIYYFDLSEMDISCVSRCRTTEAVEGRLRFRARFYLTTVSALYVEPFDELGLDSSFRALVHHGS